MRSQLSPSQTEGANKPDVKLMVNLRTLYLLPIEQYKEFEEAFFSLDVPSMHELGKATDRLEMLATVRLADTQVLFC